VGGFDRQVLHRMHMPRKPKAGEAIVAAAPTIAHSKTRAQ
jgi:hypothetical protein